MEADQKDARLFGVLFIMTFLTSIPAYFLFQSITDDPAGYIAGSGNDNQIYLAALLEFALIIANVGTAVVLYPIARRQSKVLALGYVAARIIECVFLAAGIIFVLGVLSLRQVLPGCSRPRRVARVAQGMDVPVRPWIRRSLWEWADTRVPDVQIRPRTAAHDLVRDDRGAILLIGSILTLVDGWDEGSALPALLVAPEFIWEAFLGIYCTIWGFRRDAPILQAPEAALQAA